MTLYVQQFELLTADGETLTVFTCERCGSLVTGGWELTHARSHDHPGPPRWP